MGFFNKDSKKKPEYLNVDLSEFNLKWDSFSAALPHVLDTGSLDVKKSEFKLPSGVYILFSHNGKVKAVLPPSSKFSVKEYLQWVPEDVLSPEVRESLAAVSQTDDIYKYDSLVSAAPDGKEFLSKLFYTLTIETILRLDEEMASNSIEVLTEPIFSDALEASVLAWDYLDAPADQLIESVDFQKLRNETAISRMAIETLTTAPLLLHEEWKPSTTAEKFIYNHASNKDEVAKLVAGDTDGILTSTLLETLERLLLEKKVMIEGREEKADEALPEVELLTNNEAEENIDDPIVNEENDNASEISEAEDEASAIDEDLTPGSDTSAFAAVDREELSSEDEDDEWSFEEEILDGEDDRPHFIPTGFILLDLKTLVNPLLKEYEVSPEEKKKIRNHMRVNKELEKEVLDVEADIEPLSFNYTIGVDEYDEMKFDKSLNDLKNDDDDPTESEAESVDDAPEMVDRQDESNDEFFILTRLEEDRYKLNEARKKELYGLLGAVPFDGDDARTIELQDAIEAKIRGIDHVRNIAFHVSLDARKHEKLVAELMGEDVVELGEPTELPEVVEPEQKYLVDIDAPDPRPTSLAFIYYQLVDETGLDPLELYKEDMRIKRDGGDPYAPRPTKYSRALNDKWEALQKEKEDNLEDTIETAEEEASIEAVNEDSENQ